MKVSFKNNLNSVSYYQAIYQAGISNSLSFKGAKWNELNTLVNKSENIADFIENGYDSKICNEISILKDIYNHRLAFKNPMSVGEHTSEVLRRMVESPQYLNSPKEDKEVLVWVAFLHDVAKFEQVIKRSDLVKPDFEKNVMAKMDYLKIFNKPQINYVNMIKKFFNENPDRKDCVIHNNIHNQTSRDLAAGYFKYLDIPEDKKEIILLLIKEHQYVGQNIDKHLQSVGNEVKLISDEEFNNTASITASKMGNLRNAKMLKAIHLADARGLNKEGRVSGEILNMFDDIFNQVYLKF